MSYEIKQIAALLGLEYRGNGSHSLRRVSNWDSADSEALCFAAAKEFGGQKLDALRAGCIIVPRDIAPPGLNAIISSHPKYDFARASDYLHPKPASTGARHPTALISKDATLGENVELGPYAVVESGVTIGDDCIVRAGAVVGERCRLGRRCILHSGVVLCPDVRIGDRVILHAGVIVGGDGFGYVSSGEDRVPFPQVGSVILEDDVEIGCNTTIDRGSLGTTRISKGAKIDNLVQIAHNVEIGRNVVIAAQTGISGSTVIEDDAVIGGQVGFGDHARVQKGAIIGSKAGVLPGKIVRGGETYWGVPVRPLREYKRLNAHFGRLPEMRAEIKELKKEVAQLRDAIKKLQS